jgi:hypothetical protein
VKEKTETKEGMEGRIEKKLIMKKQGASYCEGT